MTARRNNPASGAFIRDDSTNGCYRHWGVSGGVDALREIVAGLPADLAAAVFVTLHIGAHRSDLPWLLSRAGVLPATHPIDGEKICAGHVYVAPPDHHMLVEPGHISLTKGPRENWARPAIDPMFRSAARAYGSDVIGVILTGGLNDGTAGMYEVKACNGTTIVQDPSEAVTPNMPQSVIAHVAVDHVARIDQIAALLTLLVGDLQPTRPEVDLANFRGKKASAVKVGRANRLNEHGGWN